MLKHLCLLALLVLLPGAFTSKVAKEDALVVMRGFCDGLDIDADVKPEAFKEGDDIADVITLLSAENSKFAMRGLKKLGATLGKIHTLITNKGGNKGADDLYLAKILELASNLEAIDAYKPNDNNNITINGVSIIGLVNNATLSLNAQDYYNAGFYMGSALANVFTATQPPISEEVLAEVQEKAEEKGWTPGEVSEELSELKSVDDLRHSKLGIPDQFYTSLINEQRRRRRAGILPVAQYDHSRASYPASFDARQKWPKCVLPVRNQGQCGSCWAFAGTSALADRFCIASQGKINRVMSPQHMLECEKTSFGCNGGFHYYLAKYAQSNGMLQEGCLSYSSGPTAKLLGQCPAKCKDGSKPNVYYTSKTISINQHENDIKKELMENGPLATSFTVYQDFMSYKGGIYSHVSGGKAGGHAVKLIGWGTDEKTKKQYWLCQNSWGSGWGEKGFFRIRFGDSDINSQVTGGVPDMKKSITNNKNGADIPSENGGGNTGGGEFKKKKEPEPEPEEEEDDWRSAEEETQDDFWSTEEKMEEVARVLVRPSVRKTKRSIRRSHP